jgi:hypothetical protein
MPDSRQMIAVGFMVVGAFFAWGGGAAVFAFGLGGLLYELADSFRGAAPRS